MRTIILLLTCLLLIVATVAESKAVDRQQNWHFNVYLDDSPIGYHHYNLKRFGDAYQLSIKAEFDVKFLFLSVYKYLHENSETWQGQCLTRLTSNTDDNGDNAFVKLRSEKNKQIIETRKGTETTDECLRSFAYWDPELLNSQRLLNAQTGELINVEFKRIGNEIITINQQSIDADRYRIKGEDIDIDIWYSPDQEWLALQSVTEGGYVLRYERENRLQ
ncbi:MAG: DUF6134 family protein [Gammaproteobacteria bacterium]|nr:DUF6134 family protein [Gammaproteobacteria bacterium]